MPLFYPDVGRHSTSGLEKLINDDAAETLIADTGDAPTYDEETGAWVLQVSIANANGEYLGVYTLPDTSLCSVITAVVVISASAPAAPNAPARVLPCGADPVTGWEDLASIGALAGQQFVAFSIRSATPFEVEVQVGATWCHEFDFTVENGDFTAYSTASGHHATWVDGTGWQSEVDPEGADDIINWIGRNLPSAAIITRVDLVVQVSGAVASEAKANITLKANGAQTGSTQVPVTAGSNPVSLTGSFMADYIEVWSYDIGTPTHYLKSLTIQCTGSNPLITNNCP
jgi:hypothetical protein